MGAMKIDEMYLSGQMESGTIAPVFIVKTSDGEYKRIAFYHSEIRKMSAEEFEKETKEDACDMFDSLSREMSSMMKDLLSRAATVASDSQKVFNSKRKEVLSGIRDWIDGELSK